MKFPFLLSLLICLTCSNWVSAQNLAFTVNSTNELPGSPVTIDVSVENFNSIVNYQGTITWDENILDYQSVTSPFPELFNLVNAPGGNLPNDKATFLWTDPFGGFNGGQTKADGEVILQITFLVMPAVVIGTNTTVNIDGSATPLGYADISFQFFTPVVNAGTVNVGTGFPVEFLDFQAKAEDGLAKLEWITASESGNDYFEIQKSENGSDFYPIGTRKGAGNSQEHTYYSFDDPINATEQYYRLLQVDFDGASSFSDVVKLSVESQNDDWIKVFPNPSSNQTQIRLENWEDLDHSYRIQLYSIDGKLLKEERIDGANLITDYQLAVAQFPRGSYLLKVTNSLGKTANNLLILE